MRRAPKGIAPEWRSSNNPEGWDHLYRRDFTGGENLKFLPEFLEANQVVAAHNCVITDEGILATRPGKQVLTLSLGEGPIISIHRYCKEDGSKYLIAQFGTSLYCTAWDGVNLAALDFGEPVKVDIIGGKLRSCVWKDKIFFCNGADGEQPFYFDGSSWEYVADAPKGAMMAVYAARLWVISGNLLYCCEVENPLSWNPLDVFKVRDGDGDSLVGLSPQDGGLLLFKQRSCWPLFGTNRTNWRIPEAPLADVGAVSPDAILHEGLMLSMDNLYQFSLQGVTELKQTHTPVLAAMTVEQKTATIAIPYRRTGQALFHLCDAAERCLCVHGKYQGAITSWFNLNVTSFAVADGKDDSGYLLLGDADNGTIYVLSNDYDDAGNGIKTYVKTPPMDMSLPGKDKVWRFLKSDMELLNDEEWTMSLTYEVDFGEQTRTSVVPYDGARVAQWDVAEFDGDSYMDFAKRVREPYWFEARGRRISYIWESSNRFKLLGYNTRYREAGEE